jgi:hypothetical protein
LHERHENQLRQKERERSRRHPSIEVHDIGKDGEQDAGLKQRLGKLLPTKPPSARLPPRSLQPRFRGPPLPAQSAVPSSNI